MRKQRLTFPGALYHIFYRGNNKASIFYTNNDRQNYLQILSETKKLFGLNIYAYVLMTNHIHLLIETPQANISAAMKYLNLTYSRYFNKTHNMSGHLFENRYKAKLVQKDKYLLALIRYIHLNPLKAGLCKSINTYLWSSHIEYLKEAKIIDSELIFDMLSIDKKNALQRYKDFINTPIPNTEFKLLNRERNGILGDYKFKQNLAETSKK